MIVLSHKQSGKHIAEVYHYTIVKYTPFFIVISKNDKGGLFTSKFYDGQAEHFTDRFFQRKKD